MSEHEVSADIIFKIQLLETSPQKQKEQRQKQQDVFFFWCLFPSGTFWILCNLLLLLYIFCQVCLLVKRLQRLKTGMAEKSAWDQENIRVRFGEIERKLAKLLKTTFTYPFFILIILWAGLRRASRREGPGLGEGGGAAGGHGRALPGRRSHHRRHVGGTKVFVEYFVFS